MDIILNCNAQQQMLGPGVHKAHYIDKENGAGCVSLGTITLEPGAALAMHHHGVEEVMYALSGSGTAVIDDKGFGAEAGTAVLVPANTKHCMRNNSSEPFTFLYTYPSVCVERFLET